MKIMTILGTRPEIIRLSGITRILDRSAEHVLVHTGQNFDSRLSGQFFDELDVRAPDEQLGIIEQSSGAQIARIIERSEQQFLKHKPERVLILGDTNTGLSSIVARRLGIPVFHLEAGNRCYDDRVPEEVNRRIIDHCSSVLMPYTERSRANLIAEGIKPEKIFVVGNPIKQIMDSFRDRIEASKILDRHRLTPKKYFLVTVHRAENVDSETRLRSLLAAFKELAISYSFPVICSLHPRTRARLDALGMTRVDDITFADPFGFADFVRLERDAFCTLSDSGTVQEEACILGVPNVTVRDVTERPETIECGSNVVAGTEVETIVDGVRRATASLQSWNPPPEYLRTNVAETVGRILLSQHLPDRAELEWRARIMP